MKNKKRNYDNIINRKKASRMEEKFPFFFLSIILLRIYRPNAISMLQPIVKETKGKDLLLRSSCPLLGATMF